MVIIIILNNIIFYYGILYSLAISSVFIFIISVSGEKYNFHFQFNDIIIPFF